VSLPEGAAHEIVHNLKADKVGLFHSHKSHGVLEDVLLNASGLLDLTELRAQLHKGILSQREVRSCDLLVDLTREIQVHKLRMVKDGGGATLPLLRGRDSSKQCRELLSEGRA